MLEKLLSHFKREKLMTIGNNGDWGVVRKVPQWWFLWWHYYWINDGYEHYSPLSYPASDDERLRSINKTKYIIEKFKNLRLLNEDT